MGVKLNACFKRKDKRSRISLDGIEKKIDLIFGQDMYCSGSSCNLYQFDEILGKIDALKSKVERFKKILEEHLWISCGGQLREMKVTFSNDTWTTVKENIIYGRDNIKKFFSEIPERYKDILLKDWEITAGGGEISGDLGFPYEVQEKLESVDLSLDEGLILTIKEVTMYGNEALMHGCALFNWDIKSVGKEKISLGENYGKNNTISC